MTTRSIQMLLRGGRWHVGTSAKLVGAAPVAVEQVTKENTLDALATDGTELQVAVSQMLRVSGLAPLVTLADSVDLLTVQPVSGWSSNLSRVLVMETFSNGYMVHGRVGDVTFRDVFTSYKQGLGWGVEQLGHSAFGADIAAVP